MRLLEALRTRWAVWVWNHTPNCAEMSRLTSLSFEQPHSLKLRLKMRLHYFICVWCERYARHLKFLHRVAPILPAKVEGVSHHELSEASKRRMAARLREERRP